MTTTTHTAHRIEPITDEIYDADRIMSESTDKISMWVSRHKGGFVLYWNDHVINDWAEWYPVLAIALARAAVLLDAVEQDGFFVHDPAEFVPAASAFFTAEAPQ